MIWQCAMDQQVGDLFELAGLGEVEDVVTAIMKIIAGTPDGAHGRVACSGTGKSDRLLRFGKYLFVHR